MSTRRQLDPASDTIVVRSPSFVVGPDETGHWLAVETHGQGGGIFVSRDAALGYARAESGRRPGGVELVSAPISLG